MSEQLCHCRGRSPTPLEYASEEPVSPPRDEGHLVPIEKVVGVVVESTDSAIETRAVSLTRVGARSVRGLQRAVRGRRKHPNPYSDRPITPFYDPESHPPFPQRLRIAKSQPSEFCEFHEDGIARLPDYDVAYFSRDSRTDTSASSSDEDGPRPSWHLACCPGACSADCSGKPGLGWPVSCCRGASQRTVGYFAT